MYHTHDTDMRNVHGMFITYIHVYNIEISKHEKHLRLLSSGTKLFITFEFKGFFDIRRERGSIFLLWLFHMPPSPSRVTPAQGLREQAKSRPFPFGVQFQLIN